MTWFTAAIVFLALPFLACFVAGVVLRNRVGKWLKANKKRGRKYIEAVD